MEIAIDIGGTFTDAVARDPVSGALRRLKLPSTPGEPAHALGSALALLRPVGAPPPGRLLHGTTIATNALVQGRLARVGLVTTAGFGDVLALGRMNRACNDDLVFAAPTPIELLPESRRREVPERLDAEGAVVTPLDEEAVFAAGRALLEQGVEAIAIGFLFAWRNPAHERRAAEVLARACPGLPLSLSSEVDPGIREYERFLATLMDAALKPVVEFYLGRIARLPGAAGARLLVMSSGGGLLPVREAMARPVALALSGPAAAARGAAAVLRQAGFEAGVAIDVGGTTADVALIEAGAPLLRPEGRIRGWPLRIPSTDLLAEAAGGGSILRVDAVGGLRLGPHSAGAVPGPVCFGLGGTAPTLLDACLLLGLVAPRGFAGGTRPLDAVAAATALQHGLASPLGIGLEAAAIAAKRLGDAAMAEAVRRITVARGIDPRRLPLLAAGGGGGLHAAAVAEELGMPCVVVPPAPGLLAAEGLLAAPEERAARCGIYRPLDALAPEEVASGFAALAAGLGGEGVLHLSATLSYLGQGHPLEVALPPDPRAAAAAMAEGFRGAHARAYGHARKAPLRLWGLRATRRLDPPVPPSPGPLPCNGATVERRRAWLGEWVEALLLPRCALAPGARLPGPAILTQDDATLLVPRGWQAIAHPTHLLLQRTAPP